ncbi:hypothetical protein, partial [Trichothermofontia sp.]
PYQPDLPAYPDRLAAPIPAFDLPTPGQWHPYPDRGQRPILNDEALGFLHPDIQQACLCIGTWQQQTWQTQWWGRQALTPVEFWSATKIIPLIYLVAQANTQAPETPIDTCLLRDAEHPQAYRFQELATDVISYQQQIATSNAIAHSLKLFATPPALETWLKHLTGNANLRFQGRYGEPPFLRMPELYDPQRDQVLLRAEAEEHRGENAVSAYDLTRILTMMAWHPSLPPNAQIPGLQPHSWPPLITALGTDSARYVDLALTTLNLTPRLRSPVILSKMGFGRSNIRDRSELSYTAFGHWFDTRERPARLRTFGVTLLAAYVCHDPHEEARILDARMATEVTEILRWLMVLT